MTKYIPTQKQPYVHCSNPGYMPCATRMTVRSVKRSLYRSWVSQITKTTKGHRNTTIEAGTTVSHCWGISTPSSLHRIDGFAHTWERTRSVLKVSWPINKVQVFFNWMLLTGHGRVGNYGTLNPFPRPGVKTAHL